MIAAVADGGGAGEPAGARTVAQPVLASRRARSTALRDVMGAILAFVLFLDEREHVGEAE